MLFLAHLGQEVMALSALETEGDQKTGPAVRLRQVDLYEY